MVYRELAPNVGGPVSFDEAMAKTYQTCNQSPLKLAYNKTIVQLVLW